MSEFAKAAKKKLQSVRRFYMGFVSCDIYSVASSSSAVYSLGNRSANSAYFAVAKQPSVWRAGHGCLWWSRQKRNGCRLNYKNCFKKNNFLKITPSINLFYILFKHYVRLAFFSVAGHSEPQHAGNRHHSCAFSACQSWVLIYQKPGKCCHLMSSCYNFTSLCATSRFGNWFGFNLFAFSGSSEIGKV